MNITVTCPFEMKCNKWLHLIVLRNYFQQNKDTGKLDKTLHQCLSGEVMQLSIVKKFVCLYEVKRRF